MSAADRATPPRRRYTDAQVSPVEQAVREKHLTPQPKSKPRKHFAGLVNMLGEHWIVEQSAWIRCANRDKELSPLARSVAIELAHAVDRKAESPDRGYAVRAISFLVWHLPGTDNNVAEAIRLLIKHKYLDVDSRKKEGRSNRYRLMFPGNADWLLMPRPADAKSSDKGKSPKKPAHV